jgi:predicted GTPase
MTTLLSRVSADLAQLPGPAGVVGRQVSADLSAPVRVAVVGRVSSGKSTLVNALLGSPTDGGW